MTYPSSLVSLLCAAVFLAAPPGALAQPPGSSGPPPASPTGTIRVRLTSAVGISRTNDLFILKDAATTVDLFNGAAVRTTAIDNTAAARRDLTFSERSTSFRVGPAVEIQPPGAQWSAGYRAGLFFEDETVSLTDPASQRTEISGTGLGFDMGVRLDWRLSRLSGPVNQYVRTSFDWSRTRINDATRSPAQSSTGRVTSDSYDIRGRRWFFSTGYARQTRRIWFFTGAERSSNRFDLDRRLQIDFSNVQAGVGLRADGRTELRKSVWRLRSDLEYQATNRLGVTATAALGKDSWQIVAGLNWTVR